MSYISEGGGLNLIPGAPGAIPTTFRTTAGDAIPALNILTVSNGANITMSGAGAALTAALSGTTNHSIQVGNVGGSLSSLAVGGTGVILQGNAGADPSWSTATYPSTTAIGDVLVASAANVIGVVAGATTAGHILTANGAGSAPTFQAAPAGVTYASDAETLAGTVTNKAVAPSNLKAKLGLQTVHALPVGNSDSLALDWLAVGGDGTVLIGNTGADPSFSANPTVTTIYATTFDTNVVAAGTTLSGTTLQADGTDADININITAKGAGKVIIDDLQLTTDLAVTEGGTGQSTLTAHGVLLGEGTSGIGATSAGTAGQILTSSGAASDPVWTTATYPATAAIGDVLVASAANTIGVVTGATTAGHVLMANGAGSAPTFQALPAAGITSVSGTANQITASTVGSDVTLSTPATFIAPGTIASTTTNTAGTDLISTAGNLLLPATSATIGQIKINSSIVLANSSDGTLTNIAVGTGATCPAGGGITAVGYQAGFGQGMLTALGYRAGYIGAFNSQFATYIGAQAGGTGGKFSTCVGYNAGSSSGNNSHNVYINNVGAAEEHVIRIGTYGSGENQQNLAYIAGVLHGTNGLTADTGNIVATAGNLLLPTTSSTVGIIKINNAIKMQAYGTNNFFLGGAGNFSLVTSYATNNVGTGVNALKDLNGTMPGLGTYNCAYGNSSSVALADGSYNSSFGASSAISLISGNYNCFYGYHSGYSSISYGNYNVLLGASNGDNYNGGESSNIIIGYGVAGTLAANNELIIGKATGTGDGELATAKICGIYGVTPAGTLNVALVDSNNQLGSVASLGVAQGGTGAATLTDHGVLIGNATSAITATAEGATGTVLVGTTSAAPSFSASPTVTTMNATTFDTNVAAAGVTLSGTTLAADGSDAAINITLTPKGTGRVSTAANINAAGISFDSGTTTLANFVGTTAWTPTISFAGGTTGITYSSQDGNYSRIGNICFFTALIVLTSKGSSTGNLRLDMPMTAAAVKATFPTMISNVTFTGETIMAYLSATTYASIYYSGNSSEASTVLTDAECDNNLTIRCSGFYFV